MFVLARCGIRGSLEEGCEVWWRVLEELELAPLSLDEGERGEAAPDFWCVYVFMHDHSGSLILCILMNVVLKFLLVFCVCSFGDEELSLSQSMSRFSIESSVTICSNTVVRH